MTNRLCSYVINKLADVLSFTSVVHSNQGIWYGRYAPRELPTVRPQSAADNANPVTIPFKDFSGCFMCFDTCVLLGVSHENPGTSSAYSREKTGRTSSQNPVTTVNESANCKILRDLSIKCIIIIMVLYVYFTINGH